MSTFYLSQFTVVTRSIKQFWAHLKSKVYDRNWWAKNTDQLKRKIVSVSKTFDAGYFQRLLKNLKTNILKTADSGLNCVS